MGVRKHFRRKEVIRGSIEFVSEECIRGWVYSDQCSLRDQSVLAFSGKDCIGAGKIAIYRKDLADAGLGDGYLGFDFAISGDRVEDAGSITVRLDNSDAHILQHAARVVGWSAAEMSKVDAEEISASVKTYRWMLTQGWIDQPEYEFLKGITSRGFYELVLPKSMRSSSAHSLAESCETLVKRHLGILKRSEIQLTSQEIGSQEAYNEAVSETTKKQGAKQIIALCGGSFSVTVVDGSHCAGNIDNTGVMDVKLDLAPYQLLFLNVSTNLTDLYPKQCAINMFSTT